MTTEELNAIKAKMEKTTPLAMTDYEQSLLTDLQLLVEEVERLEKLRVKLDTDLMEQLTANESLIAQRDRANTLRDKAHSSLRARDEALRKADHALTTIQGAYATDIVPSDLTNFWRVEDKETLTAIRAALSDAGKEDEV